MSEITKELLKQRWYLLGQPWCHSSMAGMDILSGSEDPHAATFIANTQDFDGDHYGDETAIALARHIVELHNASLESRQWVEIGNGESLATLAKDKYYLFGGYLPNGEWQFDRFHYSRDGLINGWQLYLLIRKGYTHWMSPEPPE